MVLHQKINTVEERLLKEKTSLQILNLGPEITVSNWQLQNGTGGCTTHFPEQMDDIPSYSTSSFFHSNQLHEITILFTHNSHFRFVGFVRHHAKFGDTSEIASVNWKQGASLDGNMLVFGTKSFWNYKLKRWGRWYRCKHSDISSTSLHLKQKLVSLGITPRRLTIKVMVKCPPLQT